jgi:hypothetical protein
MIKIFGIGAKEIKSCKRGPLNCIYKQMKLHDAVLFNNELKAKLRSLGLNKIMKHDYEC